MPDTPSSPGDLHALFSTRAIHHGPKHAHQDKMVDIYNGIIPEEFLEFFHEEQHVHVVNMTRQAWDDHAGLAAHEMTIYFEPESETAAAKARAEKRETICYGYNAAARKSGGIDMKALSYVFGWYMVGLGEMVGMVLPDYYRRTPIFTYKDPRTHYAPVGWNPWEYSDLNGTLFAYKITLGELKRRYPQAAASLEAMHGQSRNKSFGVGRLTTGWKGRSTMDAATYDDTTFIWVGEYYNRDAWYFATLEDQYIALEESNAGVDRNHPGVVPVVAASLFNPDSPRSMLADQVSMTAAMSRMFSQKLDFYDKTLYPGIFTTPLAHRDIKYGPNAVNILRTDTGVRPLVQVVSPANSVDADQMMQFAIGLQRMLNRNPESMQGGGQADSAKALNALKAAVTGYVQSTIWPPEIQALLQLYVKAMKLDINIWGAEQKKISGRTPESHPSKRNMKVSATYRPLQDLAGYEEDIELEPGILLRGFEGRQELMMLRTSGMMSLDTALEQLDLVRDPQGEKRRLQRDELEKIIFQTLLQEQAEKLLDPGALSEIADKVGKGEDLFEVIKELRNTGKLYMQAPPMQMPAMGGPPGMPALGAGSPLDIDQMGRALERGGIPGNAPTLEQIGA